MFSQTKRINRVPRRLYKVQLDLPVENSTSQNHLNVLVHLVKHAVVLVAQNLLVVVVLTPNDVLR